MIRCIVIDDEPKAQKVVEHYIKEVSSLQFCGKFGSGPEALAFLHSNDVDLMFLDINMPEITGLEMLESIHNPPLIILTTAYTEFAIESYEYGVVDYLLKPFSFQRFIKAVNRAADLLGKKHIQKDQSKETSLINHLLIKDKHTTYNIPLKEILYFEANGNYILVYIKNRKRMIIREKMNDLEEKLRGKKFIRVHRSYIVNLSKIEVLKGNTILIKEKQIPLGSYYKSNFNKAFGS